MDNSQVLKPLSDRPVSPIYEPVIDSVLLAADRVSIPLYLIGALARIILLEHVHGLRTGRATSDVDFAVAVNTWEEFEALKNELVTNFGFAAHRSRMERLQQVTDNGATSFVIDLIPFGSIESQEQTIAWPPDLKIIMSVVGYKEAFDSCATVEVFPGRILRIASIPGLAILKVFAWFGRGRSTPKDALDLMALLKQYSAAGNVDRLYQEPCLSVLNSLDHNVDLAGAWLLGMDAASISLRDTKIKLLELLTGNLKEKLVTDMARSLTGHPYGFDEAQSYLDQLIEGLRWKID